MQEQPDRSIFDSALLLVGLVGLIVGMLLAVGVYWFNQGGDLNEFEIKVTVGVTIQQMVEDTPDAQMATGPALNVGAVATDLPVTIVSATDTPIPTPTTAASLTPEPTATDVAKTNNTPTAEAAPTSTSSRAQFSPRVAGEARPSGVIRIDRNVAYTEADVTAHMLEMARSAGFVVGDQRSVTLQNGVGTILVAQPVQDEQFLTEVQFSVTVRDGAFAVVVFKAETNEYPISEPLKMAVQEAIARELSQKLFDEQTVSDLVSAEIADGKLTITYK